ncbi:MAG: thiamine phosphate synthase [Candidatus Sumerlaeia bacterium]|nr:thiamine phosphate synthase [Candidatus Sumerlaeia bacterium]
MTSFPHGPDLYCITDRALSRLSNPEQARRFLAGGARVVQLRDKSADEAMLRADADAIRRLTADAAALFIVNDDWRLAAACGADGVHLGQGDTAPAQVRAATAAGFLIGRSTHNAGQLAAALAEPVDYVAVGPVFGTSTKANADPATGTGLVAEAARTSPAPIVAIGGISAANAHAVLAVAPRAWLAVIGAVCAAPDITAAVLALRATIGAEAAP